MRKCRQVISGANFIIAAAKGYRQKIMKHIMLRNLQKIKKHKFSQSSPYLFVSVINKP